MTDRFPRLAVNEKRVLTFRFKDELEPGETLSGTPTVTVTTYSGTDPSPSAILNGSATISGPDVLVPVNVGVASVTYKIKVLVDTSVSTKKLGAEGLLEVV